MVKRRKDAGFTLIELMIVIAVIGILAIVLVPKVGDMKTSAKLTGVQTNFRSITTAIQGFNDLESTDNNLVDTVKGKLASTFKDNNSLINPITNSNDAYEVLSTNSVPNNAKNDSYVGKVVIYPHVDSGVVTIDVYGCDQEGKLIPNLQTTLHP